MDLETKYISDFDHYESVLKKVLAVKKQLWIGTANIKGLYFEQGANAILFLKILSNPVKQGVEIRLTHAKKPGPNFRTDFDKYPELIHGLGVWQRPY